MSDPDDNRSHGPVPLDYQRPRRDAGPTVTPTFIAVALAITNALWVAVALFARFGPMPRELGATITGMLLCGLAPSAIVGTLVGAIAAAGRWRLPATLANAAALAVVGWLVLSLL